MHKYLQRVVKQMFVIVDAKQNRELTFRERWKYWRGFVTEETLLDVPVTVFHCQKKEGSLVKKQVLRFTQGKKAAAVVPEGTSIPEDCGLFPHSPKRYERALCFDFLKRFSLRLPPERRMIRICDRMARHPELVRSVARFYRTVVVMTMYPSCYESMREEILEETGAAIMISSSDSLLSESPVQLQCEKDLHVSIRGVAVEQYYGITEPQIQNFLNKSGYTISSGRIAAALFEDVSGKRQIQAKCHAIKMHGKVFTMEELCGLIETGENEIS